MQSDTEDHAEQTQATDDLLHCLEDEAEEDAAGSGHGGGVCDLGPARMAREVVVRGQGRGMQGVVRQTSRQVATLVHVVLSRLQVHSLMVVFPLALKQRLPNAAASSGCASAAVWSELSPWSCRRRQCLCLGASQLRSARIDQHAGVAGEL